MKYVFNKGRYAVAFEIKLNGKERKVVFDRRRVFLDTGNVATTGVTEVDDKVYDILLENKRFKQLIESGEFELTEASALETQEKANEALAAENAKLKEALEKAKEKATSKEIKAELKAKDDEIASLKAQLESLSKAAGEKAPEGNDGF